MYHINSTNYVHNIVVVFLFPMRNAWGFFLPKVINMHIRLITNTDTSETLAYQIARIVFAETGASSLMGVEALTSMIKNLSDAAGISISDIIKDKTLFESLNSESVRHARLHEPANSRRFQMCVRVVHRMLSGGLDDRCYGAVRFHHADCIPSWATSRGYIADIDNMLFYL